MDPLCNGHLRASTIDFSLTNSASHLFTASNSLASIYFLFLESLPTLLPSTVSTAIKSGVKNLKNMLCYVVQNVEKEPFQRIHEDSTEFSPSQRTRERHSGLYSDTKNITYI